MKAFTVFMFLPASVAADGVLSHESTLGFMILPASATTDGEVFYEKRVWCGVFSWFFNGNLLHEICFCRLVFVLCLCF